MKTIPNFPRYQINEDGTRVFDTLKERDIKASANNGYVYVTPYNEIEHRRAPIPVHRLVAFAHIGPQPEDKPWINHKDGVRDNNHYTNLEWSSISDNILHSYRVLGRRPPLNMKGKTHSDKTKAIMRDKKIGVNHPKFKGFYLYGRKQFASAREAAAKTGIERSSVIRWAQLKKHGWSFAPCLNPVKSMTFAKNGPVLA